MTTRYRVEYALKTHRRDQFIEWIKGLLAVPFVLHSQPTAVHAEDGAVVRMAETAHRRYAEIMRDVEALISDHITFQGASRALQSKLKHLVPSIGTFFTPLALHDAFVIQDTRRSISRRRFVAPSFNDIRLVLNTAQVLSIVRAGSVELITFDGDVTLYDDGESLTYDNPVISRILELMAREVRVGIVTAAGYTEAARYYGRLFGLLDAVSVNSQLSEALKRNLVVMGGEASYLFEYASEEKDKLRWVSRDKWALHEMKTWTEESIKELLDVAESALRECISSMNLEAQLIRKERAVGIVPKTGRFAREQLEETVLVTQKVLEMSEVSRRIPFCAFNGGNDVFVDIGDKSYGVASVQHFFGARDAGRGASIAGAKTLHVGDQFLSAGANDFKTRLACTTAWIANPAETVTLLDDIIKYGKEEAKDISS